MTVATPAGRAGCEPTRTSPTAPAPGSLGLRPIDAAERAAFERDGYLIVRAALTPDETSRYAAALDRVYARERSAGRLARGAAMHMVGAAAACPETAGLVDHPSTLRLVWSILGWNIHVYHSHLDVHPTIVGPRPPRFEWHQDGGRQNRELETDPRPRLSVKVAYWLSDVSTPGRGNLAVVPGSHLVNRIDGPPRRDMAWPDPDGAIEICAGPGDAVFFDRRLWHTRTANRSPITRKGVFFAYAHRWSHIRDAPLSAAALAGMPPVRRQLLGAPLATPGQSPGDHQWGHHPETTPLYTHLKEHGLLDSSHPPLIP